MEDQIKEYITRIEEFKPASIDELESFRIEFLGGKGIIKQLFQDFKQLPKEQKKTLGKPLNELKVFATDKYNQSKSQFETTSQSSFDSDVTLPGHKGFTGTLHPIHTAIDEIIQIFERIGFSVAEGPEIEDDWHNFSALNFPPEHPARDMQDTFFVAKDPDFALRTHTSSVQVRVMETEKPPIRIIAPGRVFRNEDISARSHCIFHQIEGLYIDKGVSFADLKQTLLYFAQSMYGKDVKIRLRPSYFPFTEPSAELDVYWGLETESDYRITKGTGWLEILGCGMVDPAVLESCGIDSKEYSGFAFGMGIERQVMRKYGIDDIRHFFQNDVRFLNQFKSVV